jgi:large subunit ribosomal protein L6
MQHFIDSLDIPEGVSIVHHHMTFTIKGKKGEVILTFTHPAVEYKVEGNQVHFYVNKKYTQREKKTINTYKSHLKNACKGVMEPHVYKLKVCSGHFPMSVAVKGKDFEVKNFLGEKVPRRLHIKDGAAVKVDGDVIVVEGIALAIVSQVAADIEELTKRPGFDKRIFMDGIWMIEKDGEALR